jgi:bis(5'-nucleosyl)-tetraphosphatase (symmetrical)
MTTYAIGDVQGCFLQLESLLKKISFNPLHDQLWFTGDLVNRGPNSLDVLRFIKNLGNKAIVVLGNHDLHLLAVFYHTEKLKSVDTFIDVLQAPDCEELCDWLKNQKLFHFDANHNYALVHAGLVPQWNLKTALQYASEVEAILKSNRARDFLFHMYGAEPDIWQDNLTGWDRLRFITNCFTRLRFCDKSGRMDLKTKTEIGSQPEYLYPWFAIENRASKNLNIIFGHWAALFKNWTILNYPGIFPLDSGCVWGNCLTAMRLEDKKMFQVSC